MPFLVWRTARALLQSTMQFCPSDVPDNRLHCAIVTPANSPITISSTRSYKDSALHRLPRELMFLVAMHSSLSDVFVLAQTCHYLHDNLVDFYIRGLKRFVLDEQVGDWSVLLNLLQYDVSLEVLVLGERLDLDAPPIPAPQPVYSKCFQILNTSCLMTLILKGCGSIANQDLQRVFISCTSLTAADLSCLPQLSDRVLKKLLQNNPSLVYLCLEKSHNAVSSLSISQLPITCTSMRTLSLSYCLNVDDRCVAQLALLPALRELSLAHCYDISAEALRVLCQRCTDLAILSLEWCFNFDDSVLKVLASAAPQLQILGIEHCGKISDKCLAHFVSNCSKLRFLSVDGCGDVGIETARALGQHVNIRDMFMNTCERVDDECMSRFMAKENYLHSLGVEECAITDASVALIARFCPHLRVLGLNGNSRVTDVGVVALVKSIPKLMRLYLSDTSVTDAAVEHIAIHCINIFSLSLVGCGVSVGGITTLGDPAYKCARSLQDLHLSSALSQMYPGGDDHDLRQAIFLSRGLGIPADKCCHIYLR